MASLRFNMLGTFEGWCESRPLVLPPTLKSQSLLAYLILQRAHPLPRDRLIGLGWPDFPEHHARRSLTTALWHIRRCLPPAALLSDSHAVQFNPATTLWLDIDEFNRLTTHADAESLQTACRLYRGDFLDAFFDDWVVAERNRLLDRLLDALGRLMGAQEQAGADRAALETAFLLLARDPLQEGAHRLVMRAYCRLGQRNRALAHYQHCRAVLQQELGAEPEAATRALNEAIRAGSLVSENEAHQRADRT